MRSVTFQRFAALAEILMILVLGNLVGVGIHQLWEPAGISEGTASAELQAFSEGLLILLRLGSAAFFGYALLYYRRRLTPRLAGLTRNQQPLKKLIGIGLVLGIFTTIPISLLFAAHELAAFGEGLPAWWSYKNSNLDLAFWIGLVSTSVVIPPLVEEVLFRGYQRVRLVESYGTIGGVVLTGFVFALSHTRYLAADLMLLLFMLTIMISSISWTYLAQKTGSIIPAMVAHAVTNGTATAILFDVWVPLIVLLIAAVALNRPIVRTLRQFVVDWRSDADVRSLWTGLGAIVVIFLPGLALLPILGRLPILAIVGSVLLVVTLLNVYMEKAAE